MNKFNLFNTGLLLLLLSLSQYSFAQTDNAADFNLWPAIELKFNLHEKWKFSLEEQLRLKENASETDEYFTQLELTHELFKDFRLAGGMRFIKENDNIGKIQGYESHFRFYFDAIYKHRVHDLAFRYRLRYQNKNELGVGKEMGDYPSEQFRFKTSITYKIANWKLDPQISAEIYYRTEEGKEQEFSKYRIGIGSSYSFNKWGELSLTYKIENEINSDTARKRNILSLKYAFEFDFFKKKTNTENIKS